MGATPDFNRPSWNNPLDVDLDFVRDNQTFLMACAAQCGPILPGWNTSVNVGTTGNYQYPDGYLLSHSNGRTITISLTWTDKTYSTSPVTTAKIITQMQLAYYDGVATTTTFSAVTLTVQEASTAFTTTAKHFGDGSSPSNYYQTGGGSTIGDSPLDWNGLIAATGSGDTYQKLTLVFCIYPVTLGDGSADWFIFGSEAGLFIVGYGDQDGGIVVGAKDWTGSTHDAFAPPTGSPSDYGGLIPGQWNTVMIAYDGVGASSPETRDMKIWANGAEVFNGQFGTNHASMSPMSWNGYSWVGRGDYWSGATQDGMDCYLSYVWCKEEYLDPATYWSSFFDGSNKPLNIGADGSSVTGSPPDTYCPDADFTNNLGTAPSWDEIGTVPAAPSSPTD